MTIYRDIVDFDENERIAMIGHAVMVQKKTVAFITDSDKGKAERYIKKLQERFPGICVIERFEGPVPCTVIVKVGPPTQ